MTAVIGLLNKRGAAIAADSAVTRSGGYGSYKFTKNGNKMVRMSDVVPISVMLTGNGAFCRTQWDIIIRHYRQHRGYVKHKTVESCVHDFFKYIADNHLFCDKELSMRHIRENMDELFRHADNDVPFNLRECDDNGRLKALRGYLKAFLKVLSRYRKNWNRNGPCPQFKDYTIEQFHAYAGEMINDFLQSKLHEDGSFFSGPFSQEIINEMRDDFELTLMTRLTSRVNDAQLVFTGYGDSQEHPSLVSATVFEGFDDRVNYHIRPEDVICIGDERPAAICPFAQDDVINSILVGVYPSFFQSVCHNQESLFPPFEGIFSLSENEDPRDLDIMEFHDKLQEIDTQDLTGKFRKTVIKQLKKNREQWETALENYDLQAMAALAHSLIDLTGFHRIIHFEQEGVGGPVDLAVITKNEGFTWLNRKSWYHHKDIGGQYGSLGV